MLRKTGYALILFLLAQTLPLAAQDWRGEGSFGLQVQDLRRQAVVGAVVLLRFIEVEPYGGPPPLETDAHGRVEIGGLAEGLWRVDIEHPDYARFYALMRVEASQRPAVVSGPFREGSAPGLRLRPFKASAAASGRPAVAPEAPATDPIQVVPVSEPEAEAGDEGDAAPEAPSEAAPETAPQPNPAPEPKSPESPRSPEPEPQPEPASPEESAAPQPARASEPASPAAEEAEEETPAAEPAPEVAAQPPSAEPQPSSEAPAASPPPAAAAEPPLQAATHLRSARQGNCSDCPPGEWALSVEQVAAPAAVDQGCRADLGPAFRELAARLGNPGALVPADWSGALFAPTTGQPTTALRGAAQEGLQTLAQPFVAADASCRLLAVLLPAGASFTGYRYEVRDRSRSSACAVGEECGAGDAVWWDHPGIRRSAAGTLVYALFQNRSADRQRVPRLIVYFRPPTADWSP